MLDRERALEAIEASHPVVVGIPNDTSGELYVFIPVGVSSAELEDKEVLTLTGGDNIGYMDYEELISILIDDAGYIQLPTIDNNFLNSFVDLSDTY